MKRQGLVALAILAAVAVAVALLRPSRGGKGGEGGLIESGAFVDDSLGVAFRLPQSSGWTLRREQAAQDGRIATATHESGRATVRVYAAPSSPDEDLSTVFARRQEQIAAVFGVKDLDQVVATVLRDSLREVGGKPIRQWQALTRSIKVSGEKPSKVVFMWLIAKEPERSIECIGMVRFPAEATPAEQAEADGLLRDMGYVLQSFQVR